MIRNAPVAAAPPPRALNLLARPGTGPPYADAQCGFKAFRLAVCRPVAAGAVPDRFGFGVELLSVAYRAGLHLLEQPVAWNDVALWLRSGTRAGRVLVYASSQALQLFYLYTCSVGHWVG